MTTIASPGHTTAERSHRPFWRESWALVIFGAIVGAGVGALAPDFAVQLKPIGDVFISLIKMTIAPLIFLIVVGGVGQVADMRAVGRIGLKSLVYLEAVTTLCLAFSFVVVQWARPGAGVAPASAAQAETAAQFAKAQVGSISAYIQHMFPENFFGAFTSGDALQVLILALFCGVGLLLMGERGAPVRVGVDRLTDFAFSVVRVVVALAPIGVFGALAFTVGKFGPATLYALAKLVGTAWAMMALFVFVGLGAICRAVGMRLIDLIRLLGKELLVVIGTSSSETAIPGMLQKLPDAGVDRAVAGLVIPSGYSFNLDGVALTLPLSTMFVAQVYGIEVTPAQQLGIFVVMLFTSKGAAGVTGGAFGALAATVIAAKLPADGLALLLGVDRFMSLGRAVTNTIGNSVAAIVVAKWDGKFDAGAWRAACAESRESDA